MNPVSTKSTTQRNNTAKNITSRYSMKFTPKIPQSSVMEDSMASKSSGNALLKTHGRYPISAGKVPVRQDSRSANQLGKKTGPKLKDNTIRKGNSKREIVSHIIKPKEIVKSFSVKAPSGERKCNYLPRNYLSEFSVCRHNLCLSTNATASVKKFKSLHKLGKLLPNKSFMQGRSQSDTRIDYSLSYGNNSSSNFNFNMSNCDGMPRSKKVKFETSPSADLKENFERNSEHVENVKMDKSSDRSLKPILKSGKNKSSEKLFKVPVTDEEYKKDIYQCNEKFLQMPNECGKMSMQSCSNLEENLLNCMNSESFNQSQTMRNTLANMADNITFAALNTSNFKDEVHPGNLYTKMKMSEFDAKIKHLQRSNRETFEREVEYLGTLLNEIEGIKKDIYCLDENSKGNPSEYCDDHFNYLASNTKVSEHNEIKPKGDNNTFIDTIQKVNLTSDGTQIDYSNKIFNTSEPTPTMPSRIPRSYHIDAPKDRIKNLNQSSPDSKKIKLHDFKWSAVNSTENNTTMSSETSRMPETALKDSNEQFNTSAVILPSSCNKGCHVHTDNSKKSPNRFSRIPGYCHIRDSGNNIKRLNQTSSSGHLNHVDTNEFHDGRSSENVSNSRIPQPIHVSHVSSLTEVNSDVSLTGSGKGTSEMACKRQHELHSRLLPEECPALGKTMESFVHSEERSSETKSRSEDKHVECSKLANEKSEGMDILDYQFKDKVNAPSQDLCSSHCENSNVTHWLHDTLCPDFLQSCEDSYETSKQDESAIYYGDKLNANEESNESLNMESRMLHDSSAVLNEGDRQEIQQIVRAILTNRDEKRVCEQNRRRAILIIFLLMFFGLLIHVVVHE